MISVEAAMAAAAKPAGQAGEPGQSAVSGATLAGLLRPLSSSLTESPVCRSSWSDTRRYRIGCVPHGSRRLTPGARGGGRAAGAFGVSCVDAGDYVPGVVTRPFTSERLAASPACSPSCAARSSSVDSVAFLASAVALA